MFSNCIDCGSFYWDEMEDLPPWAPIELLAHVEWLEKGFGKFRAFRCRRCGNIAVQFDELIELGQDCQ